ncbi:ubiquitin carboxyl-terminal hydrolase 21 isoform X2 [Rhinatrema bivittatum]|uniref:ubiquitin carboxyl-terminal hydrolase 21 isoform X2 n=1 Tax=Rhinatrema bivittatum TaxID=194408 RepID=UPI00112E9DEA|nr:ubiquitin carboxyl-terminal hydrolase 21 isoform X2 [Rhinatrema bivittatum]
MPQASEPRGVRARETAVISIQPKSLSKVQGAQRTLSQERQGSSYTPTVMTNGATSAQKLRLLPPRPTPLDDRGKQERGRTSKRNNPSRGTTAPRRGPVKADHTVGIPSPLQDGAVLGSAPFNPVSIIISGWSQESERRKGTLTRSKSVSHGDLSQMLEKREELCRGFDRMNLNECSLSSSRKAILEAPSLKRSSSLKKLNVLPGLDGRTKPSVAATLLAPLADSFSRTQTPDSQAELAVLQHPTSSSALSSKPPATDGSRTEERTATPQQALSLGTGRVGLRNLGNTCFMNAVIQCLSSTQPLRDYFLRREYRQEQPSSSRSQQELTEVFADVIAALWHSDTSEAVNPGWFKTVFQRYVPSFTGYSQQDAQEFLKFLMDRLHVEVNRKGRRTPSILSDTKRPSMLEPSDAPSDDERASHMWKRYLEREDSKIVDLFVGQLKSCLKCQACGYRSPTFEVFCDLSLPIPKKGFTSGKVSLLDCFALFTKEEELNSENAPICDRCRQKTKSTKKLTIQRFPRILVLHLNRFFTTRFSIKKCSIHVDFPLQKLCLKEFASEKAERSCALGHKEDIPDSRANSSCYLQTPFTGVLCTTFMLSAITLAAFTTVITLPTAGISPAGTSTTTPVSDRSFQRALLGRRETGEENLGEVRDQEKETLFVNQSAAEHSFVNIMEEQRGCN